MQNSWNKYGEDNFVFEILETCDTEDQLNELEVKYISEYNATDRNCGYNRESGGSLNKHMSEETRKILSEKAKGRYVGEKNPMYGVHLKCSDETKKKLSEIMSGSGNPMYGIHLKKTDEQKKKQSEMFSGVNNPFYGKHHSEETKKKISETRQKISVRCVETDTIYESARAAMNETGIHAGSILRACKNNLRAGGFHWERVA